ncbi:type VI secretion system protein TssA [Aquabacter sp. L1I39]|uniref:type VI secretion system protein TssA n=1 Tax=Aquabacter sp. L1I39 TaxID=2820278 RepID=UPI001ADC0310|nr:type VI secretion system protein TssA [Aquabacter sp. L1I39]QTL01705.1 type VI secretion system protein TssA [Aquabacter sp. L1I39]
MTDNFTFDPRLLLSPISENAPEGSDPRADISPSSPFLALKDARALARRKERARDIDADAPSALEDWDQVARLGYDILAEKGKDLEVCAWMIEALLRLDGFTGLRTGMEVARGLVEGFWDTLFPLPDEDGDEPRLAPFIALNGTSADGTLVQPLRKVPLTPGAEGVPLWQYEQALEVSRIGDATKREARIKGGALSLDAFTVAVQEGSPAFYMGLVGRIDGALASINALSDAFSARVGADAPPAGAIRALLETNREAVQAFAAEKLAQAAAARSHEAANRQDGDAEHDAEEEETADGEAAGSLPARRPVSREQALGQILEIARFFRVSEPHSPVSYVLEETVRRARMSMTELLDELIVDQDARRYFYLASGIRPPAGDD